MRFKFRHLFFDKVEVCDSDNFPSWINHKDYEWFKRDHVLTLQVGKSIETDFWEITRIS